MPAEAVFIGIGSNIGDPVNFVEQAIAALGAIRGCRLRGRSSLYRSAPVGDVAQEDFINAVALLDCDIEPTRLLLELQAIEHAYYRNRDNEVRWGPRTLDLDIILFGDRRISDSHLVVPHPEFCNRRFVLEPMIEIDGDRFVPGYGSLRYLLDHAPAQQMQRLERDD